MADEQNNLPHIDVAGDRRILACLPPVPNDLPMFASAGIGVIPRSEWKEVDYFTRFGIKIYDQNGQGSCVGHGSVMAATIALLLAGASLVRLAACFLYGLINGGRDNGANVSESMERLLDTGVCLESEVGPKNIWKRDFPSSAFETAKRFKIIEAYNCQTFDEIGTALQLGFTVSFGIEIGTQFNPDANGILPPLRGRRGGHCMCLAGAKLINGKWYFLVINSWSTAWGINGTAWIDESYFQRDVDAFAIRAGSVDPQDPRNPPVVRTVNPEPQPTPVPNPSTLVFANHPPQNTAVSGDTLYADYVTHCRNYRQFADFNSKVTDAHECSHGIHSELRLASGAHYGIAFSEPRMMLGTHETFRLPRPVPLMGHTMESCGAARINAFYVGANRAIRLPEPAIRLGDGAKLVPPSCRGFRYQTYMVDQQRDWGDPHFSLYVLDEGVAYQNGAEAGLDLLKRGQYTEGQRDLVAGVLEFLVYGASILMAAHRLTPLDVPPLVPFFQFYWQRGLAIYAAGKDKFPFDEQLKIERAFASSADAQQLRDFVASSTLR